MSKRPTKPRVNDMRGQQMGNMIGDGPDVLLDMERAILMDGMSVCLVNTMSGVYDQTQRPAEQHIRLAMRLDGRVNKSTDRASALFLFDEDGAAAIISELMDLATRVGPEFATRLMERLDALAADKPDEPS